MPNTNLPTTNTGKLGANAVTRAPTRYINAATSSSLLLPKFQICHVSFPTDEIPKMVTDKR